MCALLAFAREEERLVGSADDEIARGRDEIARGRDEIARGGAAAEAAAAAAPLARRYAVQRDASLLAAVQTTLPIAARALLQLRLSPHVGAAEPVAATQANPNPNPNPNPNAQPNPNPNPNPNTQAAARAAVEPTPIRTFACFTPPSPFEPARGAARGRRRRASP